MEAPGNEVNMNQRDPIRTLSTNARLRSDEDPPPIPIPPGEDPPPPIHEPPDRPTAGPDSPVREPDPPQHRRL